MVNRWVFRRVQGWRWCDLQWRPATGKGRSPTVKWLDRGWMRLLVLAEHRERRQSHKWIGLTSEIYDWRATWSRLGETKWLAAQRRRQIAFVQLPMPNAWLAPVITQRFSYLVLLICNVYIIAYMTDGALKYMTGGVDSVTCKWLTPTSH